MFILLQAGHVLVVVNVTQVNQNLLRYGAVYFSFRTRYVTNTPVYEENANSNDEV